jgi:hypothetical protein
MRSLLSNVRMRVVAVGNGAVARARLAAAIVDSGESDRRGIDRRARDKGIGGVDDDAPLISYDPRCQHRLYGPFPLFSRAHVRVAFLPAAAPCFDWASSATAGSLIVVTGSLDMSQMHELVGT